MNLPHPTRQNIYRVFDQPFVKIFCSIKMNTITREPKVMHEVTGTQPDACKKSWAHGLFSCCAGGIGPVCMAFFCPCVMMGKTAEALGQGSCCEFGLYSSCCPYWLEVALSQRIIIREKEGIEVSQNVFDEFSE